MRIPAEIPGRYADRLSTVSAAAGERYSQIVARIADAWSSGEQLPLIDQLLELAMAVEAAYGDGAAALASDLYMEIAELYGIAMSSVPLAASVPEGVLRKRLEKAVADNVVSGSVDKKGLIEACRGILESSVRERANRTVTDQSVRDARRGGEFARVPQGRETCAFCIMLASQGFVYASKDTAALNGHNHPKCDCIVVPAFGDGSIEGYSDEMLPKYEAMYYDHRAHGAGDSTKGSLNNMRRALYEGTDEFPGYRETRNRLRRESYARRKAIEAASK